MTNKSISTIRESIVIFFAGLWLVIRIILEYFGFISDGWGSQNIRVKIWYFANPIMLE